MVAIAKTTSYRLALQKDKRIKSPIELDTDHSLLRNKYTYPYGRFVLELVKEGWVRTTSDTNMLSTPNASYITK